MDTQRLERLLDLYFDEGLCAETKLELEEALLSSPQARELFWKRASLNSSLRQQGQEAWGGQGQTAKELMVAKVSPTRSPWMIFTTAAVILIAFTGLWAYSNLEPEVVKPIVTQQPVAQQPVAEQPVTEQPEDRGPTSKAWVAVLRKAVAVEWLNPNAALGVGEPMVAGRIRIESGLAEIQTNRGALIAIQGPADLEIISDMEVNCRSGRLRVDVPPPAHGFLVRTASVNVVDRGTSFAMNVSDGQDAQVHVIEGLVELVSPTAAAPIRELHEGESVSVASEGIYRKFSATSEMFPSAAMVNARTLDAGARRYASWKRQRDSIVRDPSCSLYFDFESPTESDDTVLTNRVTAAKSGDVAETDGTIVGCNWTSGRWPGKRALEFKNAFDRVLFSLPKDFQALTCIASVRIDAMNSPLTTLLSSCGQDKGELQWQLAQSPKNRSVGQLRLGLRGQSGLKSTDDYYSDPAFRTEQRGTWIHLAFVWDANNGKCSQYVDGRLVSENHLQSRDSILKNCRLELGNQTATEQQFQSLVQSFSGRMDEFIMFDRAFGSEEILAYQNLDHLFWSNKSGSNSWSDPENWAERIEPIRGENVSINLSEEEKAVYSEGFSGTLGAIYVGSQVGSVGELEVTGGRLKADFNPSRHTRVGLRGGTGEIDQSGGQVVLNSLQIGLNPKSLGTYHLSGGELLVSRGVNNFIGSIDVGRNYGVGNFRITGGSLLTRRGVTIGQEFGLGKFSVEGAAATQIHIGSFGDRDGFWVQHSRSTLQVLIDDQGVTPILISKPGDRKEDIIGGNVTFRKGALLDVGFLNAHREGSWDIMKWDGELTDHGLRLASAVDSSTWRFEFVDTDGSGRKDTLRVIAGKPNGRSIDRAESKTP